MAVMSKHDTPSDGGSVGQTMIASELALRASLLAHAKRSLAINPRHKKRQAELHVPIRSPAKEMKV